MQLSRGNFKRDSITHVLLSSQSPSEYADRYDYHKRPSPATVADYGKKAGSIQIHILTPKYILVFDVTYLKVLNRLAHFCHL